MKKLFWVSFPLCLACLGANAFFSFGTVEAKAGTGPTAGSVRAGSITLRDNTDEEIKTYYSDLVGLSDEELSGTNLLKNLKPILQDFTYYSYDAVWKIYEITDREWSLSPATNDTYNGTVFDSETNSYTNYVYGESISTVGNNPYVHTLYRNRDENGITLESARIREWGSHDTDGTNREHVWCQSRGFKKPGSGAAGPAGTDVHHLILGDAYVNKTTHNNTPYGFVDRGQPIETDSATRASWLSGNIKGKPCTIRPEDEANSVFEPQDCDKGDIARACFYMVACYNNYSGNETITQYNPNLILADYATSEGDSEISSAEHAVAMGALSDLLSWHKMDPVDEYEIHRNNLIYNNYQHNRNPFIDYPEWVDYIWGTTTYDEEAHETLTYDPTSTGHVDFETDVINGYKSVDPEDPEVWVKASDIRIGDEVTIVNETNTPVVLSGFAGSEPVYGVGASITVEDNAFDYDGPALSLAVEAGASIGTFAFKTTSNTYLCWSSGNELNQSNTLNANSSWNISFNNGVPTISNAADNSRKLQWYSASPRFSCYTSTQKPVHLYKTVSCEAANGWADDFLDTWTAGCNPNGGYSSLGWADAKAAYTSLHSIARTKLTKKEHDSTTLGLAVERYDYIIDKYDNFEDFLHRTANSAAQIDLFPIKKDAGFAWIIGILVVSAAVAFPLMLLSAKAIRKKHD